MKVISAREKEAVELLSLATPTELGLLADLLTDYGDGRTALSRSVKKIIVDRRKTDRLHEIADVLDSEIRAYGGDSWANLIRSDGVPYKTVVTDVAEELGGTLSDTCDVFDIEEIIIEKALAKYQPQAANVARTGDSDSLNVLEKIVHELVLRASSKRSGNFFRRAQDFRPTTVAKLIFGGASAVTSPALRITIPAAILIAKIRRRLIATEEAEFLAYQQKLHEFL